MQTTPPPGWVEEGPRWWRADLDTTGIFRNLATLEAMGVRAKPVFVADPRQASQPEVLRDQVIHAVRQSLMPLYRNQPAVIDSLFEQYVVPRLRKAPLDAEPTALIGRFKREAYQILRQHFLEPRTLLKLGQDIPVPYPDSLQEVQGKVRMQVYIDEEGRPAAIEVIEGVHPVLDRIALRALTDMRWQPAYLLRGGKSDPIPSWTRFSITFRRPTS